jgi:DNA-binding NtrC family response regulator
MRSVVLLAEDDEIVRTLVHAALDRAGFLVIPACNGEEALALLQESIGIDMLISDVYMGNGMSGIELAERALSARPGLPILVISANLDTEPSVAGKALPFLPKPFSSATLVRCVREALQLDDVGAQSAAPASPRPVTPGLRTRPA